MPPKNKPLQLLDRMVAEVLADAVRDHQLSRRDLEARSGIGLNRLTSIMNFKTPPISIGEMDAIAQAVGRGWRDVLGEAQQRADLVLEESDGVVTVIELKDHRRAAMSDDDAIIGEHLAAQTRDVQREFEEQEDSI